jgi:hypothetical protein
MAYFSLVEVDSETGARTIQVDVSGRHHDRDADVISVLETLRRPWTFERLIRDSLRRLLQLGRNAVPSDFVLAFCGQGRPQNLQPGWLRYALIWLFQGCLVASASRNFPGLCKTVRQPNAPCAWG